MTSQPYLDELRSQLVAAAAAANAKRKRRQRLTRSGAALFATIAIGAATMQLSAKPSAASVLNVRKSGVFTYVTLTDPNARPGDIADELKRLGVEATITEVPAAPQARGNFVTAGNVGVEPIEPNGAVFQSFRITEKTTHVELAVARRAAPNEPYVATFSEFMAGGILHCANVHGHQVEEVAHRIAETGRNVTWYRVENNAVVAVPNGPAALDDDYVVAANASSDNSLSVITNDGDSSSPFTAPLDPDADCD